MSDVSCTWHTPLDEGEGVTLKGQLACAQRELALRKQVYPRLIQQHRFSAAKAVVEVEAMAAIVRTLTRLMEAEGEAQQLPMFP